MNKLRAFLMATLAVTLLGSNAATAELTTLTANIHQVS